MMGQRSLPEMKMLGRPFTPKKFVVLHHEDQPRHYQSKLSKFSLDLPDNPVRYTSVPDVAVDEASGVKLGSTLIT